MSEIYLPVCLGAAKYMLAHPHWRPPRALLRLLQAMHRFMGGRGRISPALEPA